VNYGVELEAMRSLDVRLPSGSRRSHGVRQRDGDEERGPHRRRGRPSARDDGPGAVRRERRPDLDLPAGSTSATLLYNVVGERIINARPSGQTVPGHGRAAAPGLDLAAVPAAGERCSGKLDLKNLLDSPYEVTQGDLLRAYYRSGRSASIGLLAPVTGSVSRTDGQFVTARDRHGLVSLSGGAFFSAMTTTFVPSFTRKQKAMSNSTGNLLTLGLLATPWRRAPRDDDRTGPGAQLASPDERRGARAVADVRPRDLGRVPGATAYEVERARAPAARSTTAGQTANETAYDVTGPDDGSQYRFRVTAVAGTRRSPASNPSHQSRCRTRSFHRHTADITSEPPFHADTTYVLSGFIKVANGATLTIQPGTKIVGDFEVPGLVAVRAARARRSWPRARPTADRLHLGAAGGPAPAGRLGRLIIIGNGIINRTGSTQIEGTGTPANVNPPQFYNGGTDNNDNSGVLRYVRIEFAGYPTAPNEELNSLTMAAVGAGTTIEYVQVLQGLDDSFEWFGGAVNSKYLVSYESADDHFDASEGYVGRNQFLIAFQSIRPRPRPGLAGGVASDPQGSRTTAAGRRTARRATPTAARRSRTPSRSSPTSRWSARRRARGRRRRQLRHDAAPRHRRPVRERRGHALLPRGDQPAR
jgi:hypothetical protein